VPFGFISLQVEVRLCDNSNASLLDFVWFLHKGDGFVISFWT